MAHILIPFEVLRGIRLGIGAFSKMLLNFWNTVLLFCFSSTRSTDSTTVGYIGFEYIIDSIIPKCFKSVLI
jgi:hypothetical protein